MATVTVHLASVSRWEASKGSYRVGREVIDQKTLGKWVCTCGGKPKEGFKTCAHVWAARLAIFGLETQRTVELQDSKAAEIIRGHIRQHEEPPAPPPGKKTPAEVAASNEKELGKLKPQGWAGPDAEAEAIVAAVQKRLGGKQVIVGDVDIATGKTVPPKSPPKSPPKVSGSHVVANGKCAVCKKSGEILEKPCGGTPGGGLIGFVEID